MNLPSNALRNACFQSLDGAITVDSEAVKVFNPKLDESPGDYYIIISAENGKEEDGKDKNLRTHSVEIQAVTKFGPYEGGFYIANEMERQVSTIINSGTHLDLGAEFTIIRTKQEAQSSEVTIETPLESIFMKVIRFEFLININ